MTPEEAIRLVRQNCPFEGYMDPAKRAYRDIARTVLKYLEPPARILDFGAGTCDKTAILSALGFECSACDDFGDHWYMLPGNREKILTFAHNFNVRYCVIDDETNFPFEKGEFDMLMMHEVLEHLHDSPRDLVNDLLEFVKPEGYFFVTVPNAVNLMKRARVVFGRTNLPSFQYYYWYPNPWRGHVREYVRDDVVKLTEYLNLDCTELRSCHHLVHGAPVFLRPVWVALTNIFTGGRDSWLLVAKKKPDWAPKKSLPQEELYAILDRYTSHKY